MRFFMQKAVDGECFALCFRRCMALLNSSPFPSFVVLLSTSLYRVGIRNLGELETCQAFFFPPDVVGTSCNKMTMHANNNALKPVKTTQTMMQGGLDLNASHLRQEGG